jgi:hypothetical protein
MNVVKTLIVLKLCVSKVLLRSVLTTTYVHVFMMVMMMMMIYPNSIQFMGRVDGLCWFGD